MQIKIDLFSIFISPLKHKKFIIIFTIIMLIIITAIVYLSAILPPEKSFLPDKYSSEAKIIIPYREENQRSDINSLADIANTGLTIDRGIKKTEVIISLLQTNTELDGIIDDCYLQNKPDINDKFKKKIIARESIRNIILKNTVFKKNESTGFITIAYSDTDPVFTKQMVDSYLKMLNKITIDFALTQTSLKKRFIQDRIKDINLKLNQAKIDFIDFQQEFGIISPENEALQITNTVSSLRAQLINKEADLENYRRIHKLGNNEKTDLDYEVEDLRNKIIKLTKSSSNTSEKNIIISKDTISQLTSQYENLKKNVENLENLNSDLMKELEIAQIQEKSEGSFFQVIDPPEIPTKKASPSRSKIISQAFLIVLVVSIILVMIKELFVQIKSNREIMDKVEIIISYILKNMKKRK
jgi:tyrosine-protein kinase Etk/Wzc